MENGINRLRRVLRRYVYFISLSVWCLPSAYATPKFSCTAGTTSAFEYCQQRIGKDKEAFVLPIAKDKGQFTFVCQINHKDTKFVGVCSYDPNALNEPEVNAVPQFLPRVNPDNRASLKVKK